MRHKRLTFLPIDFSPELGPSEDAGQLLSGEPDALVGSKQVGMLESRPRDQVRLKDVVVRRGEELLELLDKLWRGDNDLLREVPRREGRNVSGEVDPNRVVDSIERGRVVGHIRIEQVLRVGSDPRERGLKRDELVSELLEQYRSGRLGCGELVLVVRSLGPRRRPRERRPEGRARVVGDEGRRVRVEQRLGEKFGEDRNDDLGVHGHDRGFVVVGLGGQSGRGLVQAEDLHLRVGPDVALNVEREQRRHIYTITRSGSVISDRIRCDTHARLTDPWREGTRARLSTLSSSKAPCPCPGARRPLLPPSPPTSRSSPHR